MHAFRRREGRALAGDRLEARSPGDTIPDPELAMQAALMSAFGDRRHERTTADHDTDELARLIGVASAVPGRQGPHGDRRRSKPHRKPDPVPPALLARRRSSGPPIPRTEEED